MAPQAAGSLESPRQKQVRARPSPLLLLLQPNKLLFLLVGLLLLRPAASDSTVGFVSSSHPSSSSLRSRMGSQGTYVMILDARFY